MAFGTHYKYWVPSASLLLPSLGGTCPHPLLQMGGNHRDFVQIWNSIYLERSGTLFCIILLIKIGQKKIVIVVKLELLFVILILNEILGCNIQMLFLTVNQLMENNLVYLIARFRERWCCLSICSGVFFLPNNHSILHDLYSKNQRVETNKSDSYEFLVLPWSLESCFKFLKTILRAYSATLSPQLDLPQLLGSDSESSK